MNLALLRHPPALVAPGICYGRTDLPLRAPWSMPELTGFAAVSLHTSPLRRCAEVAEALSAVLGVRPQPDDRLLELDFGDWEGRAWDEIDRDALDRWAVDPLGFAPPRGESGRSLLDRVAGFAGALRRQDANAVVVSHGGPLRLLPALLTGGKPDLLAPPPKLGSVTWVRA